MKKFSEETRKKMSASAKARCTPEWRTQLIDRLSTKVDIEQIKKLYDIGHTQDEISRMINVSQKVIYGAMKRNGIKARKAVKRNQIRENNSSWKGDDACRCAFHRRLDAKYGTPAKCEVCGTTDLKKSYDWANLTGNYHDETDYKRMCRSCHWVHDEKINNIKHMRERRENA